MAYKPGFLYLLARISVCRDMCTCYFQVVLRPTVECSVFQIKHFACCPFYFGHSSSVQVIQILHICYLGFSLFFLSWLKKEEDIDIKCYPLLFIFALADADFDFFLIITIHQYLIPLFFGCLHHESQVSSHIKLSFLSLHTSILVEAEYFRAYTLTWLLWCIFFITTFHPRRFQSGFLYILSLLSGRLLEVQLSDSTCPLVEQWWSGHTLFVFIYFFKNFLDWILILIPDLLSLQTFKIAFRHLSLSYNLKLVYHSQKIRLKKKIII